MLGTELSAGNWGLEYAYNSGTVEKINTCHKEKQKENKN
jgi:hypothetical protein